VSHATALREAVTSASGFWVAIFGNGAPVEIEIGSGDGVFLAARATAFPSTNLLGIERSPSTAKRLAERMATRHLPNVRTLQADARCLVASAVPAASVAAYHVYFPDPWPKRAHAGRRIFTAPLVADLARTLVPNGRLFVATDVAAYAAIAHRQITATDAFQEAASDASHPGLATSFARKYRAGGRALHTFTFVRVGAVDAGQGAAASKIRSM
jgi:tRNA (guanine-N7-)-methyltransferase